MKALSIREPYASLIAFGYKTIETRTWVPPENFGGRLLLCASAKPAFCYEGRAFALASIAKVERMTVEHQNAACCSVYPGAWAWFLTDVVRIKSFEIKGALGLFDAGDVKIEPLPADRDPANAALFPMVQLRREMFAAARWPVPAELRAP